MTYRELAEDYYSGKDMSKTVNYDFEIINYVTVEAPYGVNPNTLLDQAVEKLLSLHKFQIELHCENTCLLYTSPSPRD